MVHGSDAGIVDEYIKAAITLPDLLESFFDTRLIAYPNGKMPVRRMTDLSIPTTESGNQKSPVKKIVSQVESNAAAGSSDHHNRAIIHSWYPLVVHGHIP